MSGHTKLGHVVIDDLAINLLKPDTILTGELRPVALVERLDDLGQRKFFVFGV